MLAFESALLLLLKQLYRYELSLHPVSDMWCNLVQTKLSRPASRLYNWYALAGSLTSDCGLRCHIPGRGYSLNRGFESRLNRCILRATHGELICLWWS